MTADASTGEPAGDTLPGAPATGAGEPSGPGEPEPGAPSKPGKPSEPKLGKPGEPEPGEPSEANERGELAGDGRPPATEPPPGWAIVRADVWATAVFTVVSVAAAVWSGMVGVALAVDGVLFVVGCVVFAGAFLRAVGRSRQQVISLGGLFFLVGGVAPAAVARWLWGALAVQVVVAVATAAVRPFSSLAFGVLAPMFGMALLALWGAVHGRFPSREAPKRQGSAAA